ncbi:MAG TPA: response regulator, partial [Planctomycetaceae bacterium]|nr:response regulator [Planctomycetaceae bacterium]
GLTISSRLVDLMDGRIWVESRLGEGSRFHFTARFRVQNGRPPQVLPASIAGTRVLVVDDNETNRRILVDILSNWEMRPEAVPGVAEALAAIRRALAAGEPYQVILTDVNMPKMDGFTLAERIKSDPELGSTVIMMLTSGDRPGDVARCEEVGAAAYLMKPIKQSELFDAVVSSLGAVSAEDAAAALDESAARPVRPLNVLLAEDSLANQKLAVGVLERWGHRVTVAHNGKQAVAAVQTQPFDLVLMDVQMPELDGLEATRMIRQSERGTGRHLPIIAMTAHAMKGDRERCLDAGMDSYVAKPVRAARLREAIDELLDRCSTGLPTGAAVAPSPAAEPEDGAEARAGRPVLRASASAFEISAALEVVGGNEELLKDVLQAFLEESPAAMRELDAALAAADGPAVSRAAHKINGQMRILGCDAARRTAFELEQLSGRGELSALAGLRDRLVSEVQAIVPSVAAWLRGAP